MGFWLIAISRGVGGFAHFGGSGQHAVADAIAVMAAHKPAGASSHPRSQHEPISQGLPASLALGCAAD